MSPSRELTALAARKAALRADIGRLRAQVAAEAARAVRPALWLGEAWEFSRRLGAYFRSWRAPADGPAPSSGKGFFARLVRWAPLVFEIVAADGPASTRGTGSPPSGRDRAPRG